MNALKNFIARAPSRVLAAALAPFFLLIISAPLLPNWARVPPKSCLGGCADIQGMIPFVDWVNAAIDFARRHEFFGAFTIKDITRAISDGVRVPLEFTEGVLHKGFPDFGVEPVSWILLTGLAAIYGWHLKGWKLSLLGGGCFFYIALFSKRGIWELSMQTLSAISVSAPLAGIIGLSLGILAAKRESIARVMHPFLNVMQSLPHFSYLILVAIFFGVGSKAGVIATVIFAFPPMARLTMLGIKNISPEILEAGAMAGCTEKTNAIQSGNPRGASGDYARRESGDHAMFGDGGNRVVHRAIRSRSRFTHAAATPCHRAGVWKSASRWFLSPSRLTDLAKRWRTSSRSMRCAARFGGDARRRRARSRSRVLFFC